MLTRKGAFSYACRRCRRCCRGKDIRVNPFEVARLARNRGCGTSRFLKEFTEAEGTVLRRRANGDCVFLGATGCDVHPDRPFVCRLYPLGRRVGRTGRETFPPVEPHPGCEGRSGKAGTVAGYLEAQAAGPYLESVYRYFVLLGSMYSEIGRRIAADPSSRERIRKACVTPTAGNGRGPNRWMDIDPVVARYCAASEVAVPEDPARKMTLHIAALEESFTKIPNLALPLASLGSTLGVRVETLFAARPGRFDLRDGPSGSSPSLS